jgi:hypothetical protein
MKALKPSEKEIHLAVMQWIATHPQVKKFKNLIIHIPNEGERTFHFGKLLKDLGMRKGAADLFIAHANHGFHGAWIEIKKHNGRLSTEQKIFLLDMDEQGYFTAVCYSIEECIQNILWYLEVLEMEEAPIEDYFGP